MEATVNSYGKFVAGFNILLKKVIILLTCRGACHLQLHISKLMLSNIVSHIADRCGPDAAMLALFLKPNWPSCGLVNVVLAYAWTVSGRANLGHQKVHHSLWYLGRVLECLVHCMGQNWTRQILFCGVIVPICPILNAS